MSYSIPNRFTQTFIQSIFDISYSGIAMLHFHLYELLGDNSSLEKALYYVEKPLRHLKGRNVSFLCGDAGPLAIGAILYKKIGDTDKSQKCVQR